MQARPGESIEDFVERLGAEDKITPEDAGEILSFSRFLGLVGTWPRNEENKIIVPEEWRPYVEGTGPAPNGDEEPDTDSETRET